MGDSDTKPQARTKHSQSMQAIYDKHDQRESDEGVEVDTSVDGFADARVKLSESVARRASHDDSDPDAGVSLADVRDQRDTDDEGDDDAGDGQPVGDDPERPSQEGSGGEGDDEDPLAAHGLTFDEESGELYATIKVNGEEQQVPLSQVRRDYQTAQAASQRFQEAAHLRREADRIARESSERLSQTQQQQQEAEAEATALDDQILSKQDQIDELVLSGEADEVKKARKELLELQDQRAERRQQARQPAVEHREQPAAERLSQEAQEANEWFATAYPEIDGNDQYLEIARNQFQAIVRERQEWKLPPLSAIELAREAGLRTERHLRDQGVRLDRQERTQRRRNADSPPRPTTTRASRTPSKSGATTTEDELNQSRAAYVAERKRLQDQFKTHGAANIRRPS